jgi:hypothetical protein
MDIASHARRLASAGMEEAGNPLTKEVNAELDRVGHGTGRVRSNRPSADQVQIDLVRSDLERARHIAKTLHRRLSPNGVGLLGMHDLPEDEVPEGMQKGSLEHITFLTLTVSVNRIRDAPKLWSWPATHGLMQRRDIFFHLLKSLKRDLTE